MYSSFKDTFIKKPQFTVQTPEAVLRTIGKELPEGFRYVDVTVPWTLFHQT